MHRTGAYRDDPANGRDPSNRRVKGRNVTNRKDHRKSNLNKTHTKEKNRAVSIDESIATSDSESTRVKETDPYYYACYYKMSVVVVAAAVNI